MQQIYRLSGISFAVLEVLFLLIFLGTAWGSTTALAGQRLQSSATDLSISQVKVIQGTSPSTPYTVYIADRATTLRTFVLTGSGIKINSVTARMCVVDNLGWLLGCILPSNGAISAPSIEGDLDSTLNFDPPAAWHKPGYAYAINVDPDDRIIEVDEGNNRYPASGYQPFNFVSASPLKIMVVPVAYKPAPGSFSLQSPDSPVGFAEYRLFLPIVMRGSPFGPGYYFPRTDDLSYLSNLPLKIFPVPEAIYQVHPYFAYAPVDNRFNLDNLSGDGWRQLLSDIQAIHIMEDPANTMHYYGLVNSYAAHGCSPSCITGVGYLNLNNNDIDLTALGWSGLGAGSPEASQALSHELGHNLGRRHVLCNGNELNPDPDYPYPGGKIGQYGLDVAGAVLYDPNENADYMSYCSPAWTSDYTYWNIYQFRESIADLLESNRSPVEALYVGGMISPGGEVTLRHVYHQVATVTPRQSGPFRLELLDRDGAVLKAYPFSAQEVADAPGLQTFGFFVPAEASLSGLRLRRNETILAEKISSADPLDMHLAQGTFVVESGQNGTKVEWSAPRLTKDQILYRLRLSQDGGATWQVLALDWPHPYFSIPAALGLDLNNALIEIQASDGIHTSTQVLTTVGP